MRRFWNDRRRYETKFTVFSMSAAFGWGWLPTKKGERHTFGNNCLPSISVENVKILREKLTGGPAVFPVTRIKNNWVAEFQDSEGNHVELTAPAC